MTAAISPMSLQSWQEWKQVTPEEMTAVTWDNGRRLFRLG